MENNKDNQHQSVANANAIFGTSSDAIIEGLHQGQFTDTANNAGETADDDKKIVNEQEQNEIVNPVEPDIVTPDTISPETKLQDEGLTGSETEVEEISEVPAQIKKSDQDQRKAD